MTKGLRSAGGALALTGGALMIFNIIIQRSLLDLYPTYSIVIIGTLTCGFLSVVGGTFTLLDKTAAAILILAAGIYAIIGIIIPIGHFGGLGSHYLYTLVQPYLANFDLEFIEPAMILGGGILAIVAGSET